MENCIIHKDRALVLFSLGNIDIKNKELELSIWTRLIDSFSYDNAVTLNLIFINHPTKNYIGLSIRSDCPDTLKEKVKRYSEGLAYLLVYHFPEGEIKVLNEKECENTVINIAFSDGIPLDLTMSLGEATFTGREDLIKIVFSRVIDQNLILDKFVEFHSKTYEEGFDSLDARVGVKPKYDERILEVLKKPHLMYHFTIYPSEDILIKEVDESNGGITPSEYDFYREFINIMGIPDLYVDKIRCAKSTSEIFDSPNILGPPDKVAKFILGYL